MQLNKKLGLKGALASATCALLSVPMATTAQTSEKDSGWSLDTAILTYSEQDRVTALEGAFDAKKTFAGDRTLALKFVVDALTGASPNGAAPSDQVQTFTRPSGNGQYQTAPGDTPLDDTFHDTRAQFGATWDAPINRLMRYNVGFNVSNEFDYQSMSVSGGLSHDFNKKNTTLALGGSFAFDQISPIGGIPSALKPMEQPGEALNRDGSNDNKQIYDLMLGLSQVINQRTLMQFNIGMSQANGYLNDPFKILSVVDAQGRPAYYIYEARPDSRTKISAYWDTKYHFVWGDTVDVSYRYMTDDWDINSHTVDFHYRWNQSSTFYLEPHLRWYQQSAAEFYHHSLNASDALPEFATADYRMAQFTARTVGLKAGFAVSENSEFNLRFEVYQQRGDNSPADAVGVQKNYAMFPDLDAMILQVGYSLKF